VAQIEKNEDGSFTVQSISSTGATNSENFDFVVIAAPIEVVNITFVNIQGSFSIFN
jgi:hypothetical protein